MLAECAGLEDSSGTQIGILLCLEQASLPVSAAERLCAPEADNRVTSSFFPTRKEGKVRTLSGNAPVLRDHVAEKVSGMQAPCKCEGLR